MFNLFSKNTVFRVKLDEEKWKKIIEESKHELKIITEQSEGFKNKLLLNKFEQNQAHINCFKNAKIDIILEPIKINKYTFIMNYNS